MVYPETILLADLNSVFFFMQRIFSAPITWFTRLVQSSGVSGFWLGCVFIFLVGRFILLPLFGSTLGSDKAKRKEDVDG